MRNGSTIGHAGRSMTCHLISRLATKASFLHKEWTIAKALDWSYISADEGRYQQCSSHLRRYVKDNMDRTWGLDAVGLAKLHLIFTTLPMQWCINLYTNEIAQVNLLLLYQGKASLSSLTHVPCEVHSSSLRLNFPLHPLVSTHTTSVTSWMEVSKGLIYSNPVLRR